jgi:hypothetical protein
MEKAHDQWWVEFAHGGVVLPLADDQRDVSLTTHLQILLKLPEHVEKQLNNRRLSIPS